MQQNGLKSMGLKSMGTPKSHGRDRITGLDYISTKIKINIVLRILYSQ